MQIYLIDDYCFKIKGRSTTVVIGRVRKNTFDAQADIIIDRDQVRDYKKNSDSFLINAPGEYEISGVSVFSRKNFSIVEIDEVRFCYLRISEVDLSEKEIEEVEGIDILLICLNQSDKEGNKALKIVNQIQPCLVLLADQKEVEQFVKKLNLEAVKREKKLTINKSDLPDEEMEVVILEGKNGSSQNSSS